MNYVPVSLNKVKDTYIVKVIYPKERMYAKVELKFDCWEKALYWLNQETNKIFPPNYKIKHIDDIKGGFEENE